MKTARYINVFFSFRGSKNIAFRLVQLIQKMRTIKHLKAFILLQALFHQAIQHA
nr:hypothetical protein [Helicobacter pylori]